MEQTRLTESQDQFLTQIAILISSLNQTVVYMNDTKNNMYTMINMIDRLEQKLDHIYKLMVMDDEKINS